MMISRMMIAFLIIFFLVHSACQPIVDCGTDTECFSKNSVNCSQTRANLIDEQGNNVRVTIRGFQQNSCRVSLKVEEVGLQLKEKYPQESVIAVGKTMNCNIDRRFAEENISFYIDKIFELEEEFNQSCSGPIKDLLGEHLKEIIQT
ncbi:hypothetical protein HYX13_04015 [Candidatus Woesearchaeota archaeon]|nr:hypothetical protein [Candidatus Woesearchaeota archaeon]